MRKRLTDKKASEEVLYPGNINFPERQFVDQDKYDNYDELVGFDLPNMEKAWQKDSRNEIGMPNAVVASTRAAASSAVKLAIYLLGDKATESMIKEQASAFMRLGGKEIVASLNRFEKVAQMYQEEDAIDEEVKKAKKSEDETEEDTTEAKKSEDETEEETTEAKKSDDEETKEEDTTEAKKSDDEETVEAKKSDDEIEEETVEAKKSDEETEDDGISFESSEEDEDDATVASLSQLYPTKNEVKSVASVTTKTASKKKIVANAKELSSIWDSAPEIGSLL